MKKIYHYVFGLLTGAVLILSSAILVQTFDHEARAQGTSAGGDDALNAEIATGQFQEQESVLYVVTNNPDNGEPVLLVYTAIGNYLRMVGARNLKYDRRMLDLSVGRVQRQQGGKTFPPYAQLKEEYQKGAVGSGEGDQEQGGGGGDFGGR